MSDFTGNTLAQAGAQPAETPTQPGQETAPQAVKPSPTLDEVRSLLRTELDEFRKNSMRVQAQLETRIKGEMESRLAELRDAGIAVTPEQESAIRQKVAQRVQNEDTSPASAQAQTHAGQSNASQPDAQQGAKGSNPVVEMARLYLQKAGVTLDSQTPGVSELSQIKDPVEWFDRFRAIVDSQKSRDAGARTPTAGGSASPGNPISGIKDPDQLMKMGLDRLKAKSR